MANRLLAPLLFVFVAATAMRVISQSAPVIPELLPSETLSTPIPTPSSALTPEEQGDLMMAQKRYQAAVEAFKKADPNSAKVWNKMGIAYQMLLSNEYALRCYQRSIKLDAKNAHVLNNLATIYDSQRQLSAAEKMYRKALKITPNSPLILKNLGTNLLSQRKYKKAWEAYNAALALDPQIFEHANLSPRAMNPASAQDRGAMNYFMAKSYTRAGRFDEAIDYLRLSLNQGFTTPKKILEDNEFASLRSLLAFQQLLDAQKAP